MAYGVVNADKLSGSNGGSISPDSSVFRNRIINGAMVIDQRNAGASVTVSSDVYTLDRWYATQSVASKFSVQQNAGSVTPPAGYTKYLGCTSLSAYSVGASDNFSIRQYIEGFNVADFAWGTASASPVTISFWVRSSLTGTFGGVLKNSANDRIYPFTYIINSANTWEQKSITIAGDTSGTWITDNGIGLRIVLSIGAGSTASGTAGSWGSTNYNSATGATSVVGTNGATFYLTGVQLEKGSTATSFDYRPYGTELALCQRYYWKGTSITWTNTTTSNYNGTYISWKVSMRAAPTVTSYSTVTGTSGKIRYQDGSSDVNAYIPSPTVDGSSLSVNNVSTAVGSNMFATVTAEIEL